MRADLGEGVKLFAIERGEQSGAGFEIEADAGAEMQLAGGVFAWTDVNGAAARIFRKHQWRVECAGRASSYLRPEAPYALTSKTGCAESEAAATANRTSEQR